jgi:hypothetical protein
LQYNIITTTDEVASGKMDKNNFRADVCLPTNLFVVVTVTPHFMALPDNQRLK